MVYEYHPAGGRCNQIEMFFPFCELRIQEWKGNSSLPLIHRKKGWCKGSGMVVIRILKRLILRQVLIQACK